MTRNSRGSLADEVKWLKFRDRSHPKVLLCLLAKAKIDTTDQRFVSLYVLSAAGPHTERYVTPEGTDFDGLIRASEKLGPETNALIRLAGALSNPPRPADIAETFASLADTPSMDVAIHALRLRWEL